MKKIIVFMLTIVSVFTLTLCFSGCGTDKGSTKGIIYEDWIGGYRVVGIKNAKSTDIVISSTYKGKPVVEIKDDAFKNNDSITSVVIPDSVKEIGDYAFYDCDALASVTIGSAVYAVGKEAFAECSKMTSLTLRTAGFRTGSYWINGSGYGGDGITLTFEEGVTFIASSLFKTPSSMVTWPKITTINIPKTVTSVGSDAFYWCLSIKKVYYGGTLSQWNQISFGNDEANPLEYADEFYIDNVLVAIP